jgi:hypothetical protein
MYRLKKIFVYLAGFVLSAGIVSGHEVEYRFYKDNPLRYSFSIRGNIYYHYEGAPEEKFSVLSKGEITLETIEDRGDFYIVRLTPSKTLLKLNDMVLEDITAQDTAMSQTISTTVMEIKKNGMVMSAEESNSGILNLSQMLIIMPVFPEKLSLPWKQTVPAFSLPGVPMCALEFTYRYREGENALSNISLIANSRIRETRKDGATELQFTGLNSSKGEFLFDRSRGEVQRFDGLIDLILKMVFKMPPEGGITTKQSPPLTIRIKLNVNLSAVNR